MIDNEQFYITKCEMNKKYSVLSFLFGNYDLCREPYEISDNCEYIFVTDNKNIKSDKWKIIYTDKFKNKSPIYASFYVRYHPFEFVNTNTVIIIDASIQIKKNLDLLIKKYNENNYDACFSMCSYFNGTFMEGIKNWKNKSYNFDKSSIDKFLKFCDYYNMNNYKGIMEATFRIIKKTDNILELNDETFETCKFLKGKDDIFRVDQYVFSVLFYAKYINKIKTLITGRNIMQSDYLQYCVHNSIKPIFAKNDHSKLFFNNIKINNMLNI